MKDHAHEDADTVETHAESTAESADTVAQDQQGQYIEESTGLERVVGPNRPQSGQLESQDLDSIRAKNVTMTQSGAETIDAETVTISNGGAKSIKATNVQMQNSGAMMISADSVTMTSSSGMLIAGQKIDMGTAGAFGIQAETITVSGDSGSGLLIANNVSAERDVKAFVGIIGTVKVGAKVELLFDAKSALALGAAFALVFRLIGRRFQK